MPELDEPTVLALLEDLTALPTYMVPSTSAAHTRHYMPDGRRDPKGQQGREGTDKVLDAFLAVAPAAPLVVTWPVELGSRGADALALLAARLPYLGRSESVCEAAVTTGEAHRGLETTHADCRPVAATAALDNVSDPAIRLLALRVPLDMTALVTAPQALRRAGRLEPPGTYWARYASVGVRQAPQHGMARRKSPRAPVTAIRWVVEERARPSRYAAVVAGDVLRAALMSQFGNVVRNGEAARPERSGLLSGRDEVTGARLLDDHAHAHFLALPDENGLIESLVLWTPNHGRGLADHELAAATRVRSLRPWQHQPDLRAARVAVVGYGQIDEMAPELVGPAAAWASLTPFAPARHLHRRETWPAHVEAEVQRELQYRGLPPATSVEIIPGEPWLAWRRHRVADSLSAAVRATGVRITFAASQRGPLALGALSHFGLGLFKPVRSS